MSSRFLFKQGPEMYVVCYAEHGVTSLSLTIPLEHLPNRTQEGTLAWTAQFDAEGRITTLTRQKTEYLDTACARPITGEDAPKQTSRWIHQIGADGAIASSQREVQTDADPCVSGSEGWYTGLESYTVESQELSHVEKLLEKASNVRGMLTPT